MTTLCRWCGSPFTPRATGGRRQRFCSAGCRRAYARAAWSYVSRVIEEGSIATLALRTFATEGAGAATLAPLGKVRA